MVINQPNPNKCLDDKTFCPFGQFCLSASTCDKVLNNEIVQRSHSSHEWIRMFVAPPTTCFKSNGKR